MKAGAAATIVLLGVLRAAPAGAVEVKESHRFFGQILQVRVEGASRENVEAMIREAVAVARRLEDSLSTEDPSSEASLLSDAAGGSPRPVSADLYRLLSFCRLMTRSTGRAFDVTVGPLLRRRLEPAAGRASRLDVNAALALVGAEKIVLEHPDRAGLSEPGMSVDFGAVARGYTLSRMAAALREAGASRALLEFTDSLVFAIGPPAEEGPQRVRIARGRAVAGSVALRDSAVATVRARRRGEDPSNSWVVDPRSGRFVDSDRQATVVALDPAIAEAWATALVADPHGALLLLGEPREVEALVFDEHGEHATSRFAAFADWKEVRSQTGPPSGSPRRAEGRPRDR